MGEERCDASIHVWLAFCAVTVNKRYGEVDACKTGPKVQPIRICEPGSYGMAPSHGEWASRTGVKRR